MQVGLKWALGFLGALLALPVCASGGGKAPAEGVNYIAIAPALVVNYGGPGKARFIKAELSIRTETGADATEVIHHLPLIRDKLISILSAQTEESISSPAGKEHVRIYALSEMNKALLMVEGHSVEGHGAETHASEVEDEHHATAGVEPANKSNSAHTAPDANPESSAVASTEFKPVKGPASDLFFNNFVVQK